MAKTNGNPAAAQPQHPSLAPATIRRENDHSGRPANQQDQLKSVLKQSVDRLAEVLPTHLTPERMINVVLSLNLRTPKLQACSSGSILVAVMQSAALGLDLSPTMGEAYLIPRGNVCHFQPGYRGLIKLARNSGAVKSIRSEVCHERDQFAYRYTPDLEFLHEPYLGSDRGAITHVYAFALLAGGERQIEVMSRDDIEAIRRRSQTPDAGPWKTDWSEMARKTVIKRLCKRFPMSAELAQAIDADNRDYEVPGSPGEVRSRVAPQRGMAGLSHRLGLEDHGSPPSPSRVYSEADEPTPEPAMSVDPATDIDVAQEMTAEDHWPAGRE